MSVIARECNLNIIQRSIVLLHCVALRKIRETTDNRRVVGITYRYVCIYFLMAQNRSIVLKVVVVSVDIKNTPKHGVIIL